VYDLERTIRWLPDYAIGVERIDQEHQRLFALAAKLDRAIRTEQDKEVLNGLMDDLVDYTVYHFAHEESLMERIGYPHHREHCLQHEEARQKLLAKREEAARGAPGSPADLMQLLLDWLKCHTTTTDRRVGIYMERNGLAD
jgi:hemerythrin-like metal-binding protein